MASKLITSKNPQSTTRKEKRNKNLIREVNEMLANSSKMALMRDVFHSIPHDS